MALLSACDTYKNVDIAIQREMLRQECFGEFTNTCTSKNIDYDIALLKAGDATQWIPFKDVTTKEQMVEVFGEAGWTLFEQSVDDVRDQTIAHLQSRRPGRLTRWFLGDQQPFDGGVREFVVPGDLVPIRERMKNEFVAKLKDAGWQPSADALARFGGGLTQSRAASPARPSGGEPTRASASAANSTDAAAAPDRNPASPDFGAADGVVEPSAPRHTVKEPEAALSLRWQAIEEQIAKSPDAFVQSCVEQATARVSNAAGQSQAPEDPVGFCQNELAEFRNCIALNPYRSLDCYAATTRHLN